MITAFVKKRGSGQAGKRVALLAEGLRMNVASAFWMGSFPKIQY
jgi:hypothetical protein